MYLDSQMRQHKLGIFLDDKVLIRSERQKEIWFLRVILLVSKNIYFCSIAPSSSPQIHSFHGLRTLNEAFFYWNPELLELGRQIGQINSVAFGIFSAKLSAPILVQWVPCPCFPLFNHYFYNKLSLYIHIPNIYLGLGFEFGI